MPSKRKSRFPVRKNERVKKQYTGLSLPFHGNWVGPGWSAGEKQESVINESVPAVDYFDQTAKNHDQGYAWVNENVKDPLQNVKAREELDKEFVLANYQQKPFEVSWTGLKQNVASSAVNIQRLWNDITHKDPETPIDKKNFITPSPAKRPGTLGISPAGGGTRKKLDLGLEHTGKSFSNLLCQEDI